MSPLSSRGRAVDRLAVPVSSRVRRLPADQADAQEQRISAHAQRVARESSPAPPVEYAQDQGGQLLMFR